MKQDKVLKEKDLIQIIHYLFQKERRVHLAL